MKTPQTSLLTAALALAVFSSATARGQTLIIADNYDVAGTGTGFALDTGVNSGINPPITRLTGTGAGDLRYIKAAGNKANSAHSITNNKLTVARIATDSSTLALSAGTGAYDFSSALGTLGATPAQPAVYEVTIRVANAAAGSQRCSFAVSTTAGVANSWSFGVQLYRASASTETFYTIQKRASLGASGRADVLNLPITTTAPDSWGSEVAFLIRVTDAGAETNTFSSRIQVSLDGGATWTYDTSTDTTDLPYGWRFDGAGRYFLWDVAGGAGPVTYDDFSVKWISGPVPQDRTWTGGGTDNKWSTGANWGGTAPITGDTLMFAGTSRQVNSNDLASLITPSVSFLNSGFELFGEPLTLSAAITNLAGKTILGLPILWTSAAVKTWHIAPGTEVVVKAPMAVDVNGDHNLYGGGTLRLNEAFQIGSASTANPPFLINDGRILVDGVSFSSRGGFRIGSAASATHAAEVLLTNNASFYLSLAAGACRVGDSASAVTNRLIIDNSTLTMSGGDLGVPWVAGATGEVVQVGGVVSGCDLNFNHAGAGMGTYRIKNGTLEPRQIARITAGGSCSIFFDNAILRTYLAINNPFLAGLDVAEIQSGGLTLDATTADIALSQVFSGPGALTKSGSYAAVLTGANSYTGSTIIQAGNLTLPTIQTNTGAISVADGAGLGVVLTAPGTTLTAGSLSFSGSSSSVTFDLGAFPNPSLPLARVSSLSANGTVTVNLNAGVKLAVGRIKLIDYSGTIGGGGFAAFVKGTLPTGVSANLVNNVADSSIDLEITAVPGYRWTGAASADWDAATTANWINLQDGQPATYNDGLNTVFLDGATRANVNLTTQVSPGALTVSNHALAYVISGSGYILTPMLIKDGTNSLTRTDGSSDQIGQIELNEGSYVANATYDADFDATLTDTGNGAGTFAKQGGAVLTVLSTNSTYDGAVVIQQGTLRLGASSVALGSTNGSTTIAAGASLDLADVQAPHEPVFASGAGVNGQGAIVNNGSSGAVQNNLTDVTLTGDTTFGCVAGSRWDIRVRTATGPGPGLRGNGYNLTKVGGGFVSIGSQRMLGDATPYWEMNLGDILVREGTLAFEEAMSLGNPQKALVLMPGATLNFFSLGPTNPIVRTITVTNASITGGGSGHTNILNGPIVMDGGVSIRPNSASLFFNGPLSGNASLTIGANPNPGTVYLNATNTYTGDTTVTNSTLAGNGSIAGNLVMAGGSLAPGMGVGAFTVNGSATLAGTTSMELSPGQTPNSDTLNVGGTLTLGGNLVVVLAAGAASPRAGDVYHLFNKGSVGAFGAISLPDLSGLPGGLSWNTDSLASAGTLSVNGTASPPSIAVTMMSGGSLIFSGNGGIEGNTYYVLSSTNVAAPLIEWQPIATNVFGSGGAFSVTNAVNPAVPESFFRLMVP